MIAVLKRVNKNVLYAMVGVAMAFSVLRELLITFAITAYSSQVSFGVLTVIATLFAVAMFALIARLLVYVAFRISGAIFTRRSGMLYPFPIGFRDFESTALSFAFPCLMIAGIIMLPSVFFPTFASLSGQLRTVTEWIFMGLGASYFVKNNGHDYDRQSLAISLSVIPFVLLGVSLIGAILGVAR